METKTKKRVVRRYSADFKAEAVSLITSGERTVSEVARNLGVSAPTINSWYKKVCEGKTEDNKPGDTSLAEENKRLGAEIRKLKLEQEILKKAAAYFAKSLV